MVVDDCGLDVGHGVDDGCNAESIHGVDVHVGPEVTDGHGVRVRSGVGVDVGFAVEIGTSVLVGRGVLVGPVVTVDPGFGADGQTQHHGVTVGAGPSQSNRSIFSRRSRPFGPMSHVSWPFVKAVQLSLARHTMRPRVVCCSALPFSRLKCSPSKHSPTSSPTSAASDEKPNWK